MGWGSGFYFFYVAKGVTLVGVSQSKAPWVPPVHTTYAKRNIDRAK